MRGVRGSGIAGGGRSTEAYELPCFPVVLCCTRLLVMPTGCPAAGAFPMSAWRRKCEFPPTFFLRMVCNKEGFSLLAQWPAAVSA